MEDSNWPEIPDQEWNKFYHKMKNIIIAILSFLFVSAICYIVFGT